MRKCPVVVGVDSSAAALAAVDIAAAEAAVRDVPLHILYASRRWLSNMPVQAATTQPSGAWLHRRARRLLVAAAHRARTARPALSISTLFRPVWPVEALVDASGNAGLVVLARHHGDVAEMIFGSVSEQVASYAACPTLVVRGDQRNNTGPVVIGYDGHASDAALDFAFREADLRHLSVRLIHVLPAPSMADPVHMWTDHEERVQRLSRAVAARQASFPQVNVERELVSGVAADVLVQASVAASLLVVGRNGDGGCIPFLIGSTSRALTHRAHCPVVVVHDATCRADVVAVPPHGTGPRTQ